MTEISSKLIRNITDEFLNFTGQAVESCIKTRDKDATVLPTRNRGKRE